MPAVASLKENDPSSVIDWITRSDFKETVQSCAAVTEVISLDRRGGIKDLISAISHLNKNSYTHIYDAHNNLRSNLICLALRLTGSWHKLVRRSKNRWRRFLLFQFRINLFPKPFIGAHSYLAPLNLAPRQNAVNLILSQHSIEKLVNPPLLKNSIVLAPSATYQLKQWPVEHWVRLTDLLPNTQFVIVGGKEDPQGQRILDQSKNKNLINLSGQLSWIETINVISRCKLVVSGDTGALHAADIIRKPCIALIGPTAFGYPSQETSHVVELDLPCKPCTKDGRGKCSNNIYKKCLVDIRPQTVVQVINSILATTA